jgi:pimeloyl-ACP methyl ester carboxylesterase
MEGYPYPYPVSNFSFQIDNQDVRMAFMDVQPVHNENPSHPPEVVVLFHGKNFWAGYWFSQIDALTKVSRLSHESSLESKFHSHLTAVRVCGRSRR